MLPRGSVGAVREAVARARVGSFRDRSKRGGGPEVAIVDRVLPTDDEAIPEDAASALAMLALAMTATPAAATARRIDEARLVASMVRSPGPPRRARAPGQDAGSALAASDAPADPGLVSPAAAVPRGAVDDPAAARTGPARHRRAVLIAHARSRASTARSPQRPSSGRGPGKDDDHAEAASAQGSRAAAVTPSGADRMPPAVAAALAALDRAAADTAEAALARRVDEARLQACLVRAEVRRPMRGRLLAEAGRTVSAEDAVLSPLQTAGPTPDAGFTPQAASGLPRASAPRPGRGARLSALLARPAGRSLTGTTRGRDPAGPAPVSSGTAAGVGGLHGIAVEPMPPEALAALAALDLAAADAPGAYVARRIAEARLRAPAVRRARRDARVDGCEREGPPAGVAGGGTAPPLAAQASSGSMPDADAGLMPSRVDDAGPRAIAAAAAAAPTVAAARAVISSASGTEGAGEAGPRSGSAPAPDAATSHVPQARAAESEPSLRELFLRWKDARGPDAFASAGPPIVLSAPQASWPVVPGLDAASARIGSGDRAAALPAAPRSQASTLAAAPPPPPTSSAWAEISSPPSRDGRTSAAFPRPAAAAAARAPSVPTVGPVPPGPATAAHGRVSASEYKPVVDALTATSPVQPPPDEIDIGRASGRVDDARSEPVVGRGPSGVELVHGVAGIAARAVRSLPPASGAGPTPTGPRPARDGVELGDMEDIEVVEDIEDVLAAIEARAIPPSHPRAPIRTPPQPAEARTSFGGFAQTRAGDGGGDISGVPRLSAATTGRAVDPISADDWNNIELPDADAADLNFAPTDAGPPSAAPAKEVDGGWTASPRSLERSALGVLRGVADWLNGGPLNAPAVGTELLNGPTAIPSEDPPVRTSTLKPTQVSPIGGPAGPSPVFGTISTPRPPTSPPAPTGPAVVSELPGDVGRPAVPTSAFPSDAPTPSRRAPTRGGASSPSNVSPGPGPRASSRVAKAWHPGLLPRDKRALAGLFARHLVEHAGQRSHAARLAGIREALGADADELEKWTRACMNGVRLGSPHAQPLLQQLIGLGAPLKGRDDRETTGKENEEIRRHGGRPVPVRPPHDPRTKGWDGQFLAASFITARFCGNAGLEQAIVFAHAARRGGGTAWSAHHLECIVVWAADEPSEADVFRLSQPGQERLVDRSGADNGRWLALLRTVFFDVFGKPLLPGGRGGPNGLGGAGGPAL